MYNNFSSKKTKKVISALLASALVVTSAPITANAATVKKIGVGKSITYNAKSKVKKVTVKNKKVVKATKKGTKVVLKGLKAGATTVTVKTTKKTIKLNVKVGATKIAKKTLKTTMTAGTSQTVSVAATGGKGDTIKFASSNKAVLTVNKTSAKASTKGIAKMGIKAVKEGTAKLTVSSKYTGVKKSFTIKVTAAQPAPTQAPTVVSTPGITTPTATVAATKAPSVVTTPGVTAPGTTNAPGTTDAAQTPGTDATQAPGTDATQAPGTDATQAPGTDATQAPDVPVAQTGTITVTTNVTEAAIKVISGTSVVAQTTTDGTTTSATFADLANGTYAIEVTKPGYGVFTTTQVVAGSTYTIDASLELATVKSVKATSETRIQVEFNAPVDKVDVANFKVSNVTVTSATLSENKMYVILETSTMTKGTEYTLTTTGLTTNGVAMADTENTFEGKEIKYEMKLTFADNKTSLISNGRDQVLVTATLYDEDGEVVKDLDKVEIQFSTTAGSFAETRVTAQNGVATNMLTSETSIKDINALVTATVVSAKNTNLLNVTKSVNLLMTPSTNTDADEAIGASLTDIAVESCDRIILYFNKEVDVKDYTKQSSLGNVYGYDDEKMEIQIQDKATNEQETVTTSNRNVKALLPVDGNKKALCAVLDVSGTGNNIALTDNSKVVVQVSDKTKTVTATQTKSTLVSDIRVPAILGVSNPEGSLTTIEVTFSEPVQTTLGAQQFDDKYVADKLSHWVIDGTPLDNQKWGDRTGTHVAANVEVGDIDLKTGVDTRNVVTITLGEDANGEQIYFKAGNHSVQGNNIGDWANLTDVKNNIINTQTLDFEIPGNDVTPAAEVSVESPEQYLLTFNTSVKLSDLQTNLKLQTYNATSSKWDGAEYTYEAYSSALTSDATFDITCLDGTTAGKQFLVEMNTDWTELLDTSSKHVNYYNKDLRLYLAKDSVTNVGNGLKNQEQSLLLNDEIMKNPDVTSPTIEIATQVDKLNYYKVTMSEPVQIHTLTETTASETQTNGVPNVTVTFISADNSKTIPATIERMVDAHDNAFYVTPSEKLTAGTWKVVVAGISDDIGNTAKTEVYDKLEIEGVETVKDTSFKVNWIVAVPKNKTNPLTNTVTSATDDVVYVKFNKQFKTYGGAANAVSTTNYTVNGIAVPTTSKIDVSLAGYNENANLKNSYTDLVAIHLAPGTLNSTANTVNIGSTIEAITGGTLSNYGMRTLDEDSTGNYFSYNYKKYDSLPSGTTKLSASALATVLANAGYVNVDLVTNTIPVDTDVATTDFTISHAGTYDFGGATVKSLTINTEETGNLVINNLNITGDLTVNAPNAETVIGDTSAAAAANVTIGGNLIVEDVMSASLKLDDVTVTGKVSVTDNSNGCRVVVTGNSNVPGIEINTTGNVILDANVPVEINKAATVTFENTAPTSITVNSSVASNVKIENPDNLVLPTVKDETGKNVDVTVTTSAPASSAPASSAPASSAPASSAPASSAPASSAPASSAPASSAPAQSNTP